MLWGVLREEIEVIIRTAAMKMPAEASSAMWRMVERCDDQARQRPEGSLYLPEQLDDERAEMVTRQHNSDRGVKSGHGTKDLERVQVAWVNYWLRCLARCPAGPTLFCPRPHVEA